MATEMNRPPQGKSSARHWLDDFEITQYGTSMHWPYCTDAGCPGCLPALTFTRAFVECAPAIGVHYRPCDCVVEISNPQ